MTKYQQERLRNSEVSLPEKFKTIYSITITNGNNDSVNDCLHIIADSTKNSAPGYFEVIQEEYQTFVNAQELENKNVLKNIKLDTKTSSKKLTNEVDNSKPITIQTVSEVEKRTVKFLIEPYIVKNNVNAIVGDGGVGKTFVWVDFCGATSKGSLPAIMGVPDKFTQAPDNGENHTVLYFTSEDGTDTTLKERFEKAGANLSNLKFVSSDDANFHKIMLDSKELEECIALVRPALTVFDPLQSFVHGKMGERNNMRRQMDYLTMLAQKYDTTFLIVVHTNKLQTSDARTKLSDSSDIWDKCRSVLFVGRTKDGLRYLSQEKGNYTTDENRLDTQLFTIEDNHIVHKGTTDKKFFDFASESAFSGKDTSVRDSAKDFIIDSLKGGEMLVKDLDDSAKSFGISNETLRRAKKDLKSEKKIKYRTDSNGIGKGVIWFVSLNT